MKKGVFGPRLRSARMAARKSQRKLAEDIGSSQGYLCQLESGIREPSMEMLQVLSATLGVSRSYLIGDEEDPGIDYNSHPWAAVVNDKETAPGLLALATDDAVTSALDIHDWEWIALRSLKLPNEPDEHGYLMVLMAIRAAMCKGVCAGEGGVRECESQCETQQTKTVA